MMEAQDGEFAELPPFGPTANTVWAIPAMVSREADCICSIAEVVDPVVFEMLDRPAGDAS